MNLFCKKGKIEETTEERAAKIINDSTNFAIREAYNTLHTNIMFSIPKKKCKRIIVTGAVIGEGKTVNAINLAITFAQAGARVLLMECDLRRPNIGVLLGLKRDKGLSNVLAGYVEFEKAVSVNARENLDVICAGEIPPNPPQLLGSGEFESLMKKLEEKYDYIIFDTAPVNLVTDTLLLTRLSDGIVFVVRNGKTKKEELKSALNFLKPAGAKIIGFVYNDVPTAGNKEYKEYR